MQQTIWITNNSFITELLWYQTLFKGPIFYILTNDLFLDLPIKFQFSKWIYLLSTMSLERITNNTTSKISKNYVAYHYSLNKVPNTSYLHTYKVKVDPLALSHIEGK